MQNLATMQQFAFCKKDIVLNLYLTGSVYNVKVSVNVATFSTAKVKAGSIHVCNFSKI